MSVSLISRQLGSLRVAQRAVASGLVLGREATPVAASHLSSSASQPQITVGTSQPSDNSQWPIKLDMQRFFSNTSRNPALANHDGGPVTGGETPSFKGMSNTQLADMSTIPGWNLVHNPPRKNPRGALVGKVVSDKMQKTVNVAVDRYKMIPKYRKRWRFTRKFMAHDEHEVCNVGDLVMIVPCQKISRHKHFMVREIIRAKGQL